MPLIDRPAGQIHYEVIDFGPPWQKRPPILLHHGLALAGRFWYAWLPILAAEHPIVTVDMRGHGESAPPGPGYRWTMAELAGDALAVLDALGHERCHFVGESVGGTLGLYLAARHPERVITLSAASTAYRGDQVRNLDAWDPIFAAGGSAAWSRLMMDRRFDLATLDPAFLAWYETEQAKTPRETAIAIKDLLVSTDLTDDLAKITAPTLLLSPESSPFVGADLMRAAHERIAGSELLYFRGARHGLINSHPEAGARAVVEFIRRR